MFESVTYGNCWIKNGKMIINVVDVDCVRRVGLDKAENEIIFKNGHKVPFHGDIEELWEQFRDTMLRK